ncbi:MAG: nicotinate phosphoribosyltransferase [Planctomycetes bacterium]|nr:nicotinate phosphoribosyltransferase [Planctomycetota bacterium]
MAAGYLQNNMNHPATFELFIRRLPENRPFLIAAGLEQALHYLTHLRFSREAVEYIRRHPAFKHVHKDFFSYLKKFRFSGEVFAIPEGTPVFAEEPLLRVTAPMIETQLVETYLLATINFQTLIASKAVRVVLAARGREVVDFGSRRAHGSQAAVLAARACFIGGCRSTSNVLAGQQLGIPVLGTMAHSWVMAFDTEEESFRAFHRAFPENTALLIDTYDTLRAARLAKELNIGDKLLSVRLDSGDLLSLSKGVRKILDEAGLGHVKIMASGDLNEDRIDELMRNDAPIDIFGVGTEMVTSRDQPALGGIYKLVEQERYGRHVPRMKFSEDKVFYPSSKQVYRFLNHSGIYERDVIGVEKEDIGGQPLLEPVMHKGKLCKEPPDLKDIQSRTLESLSHLPEGLKRLRTEEAYTVRKSQRLEELKRQTEEGLRRR